MSNNLRVELAGMGRHSKVFYGDTEISDCITGIEIVADVDGFTRARISAIVLGGVTGEDITVSEITIREIAREIEEAKAA